MSRIYGDAGAPQTDDQMLIFRGGQMLGIQPVLGPYLPGTSLGQPLGPAQLDASGTASEFFATAQGTTQSIAEWLAAKFDANGTRATTTLVNGYDPAAIAPFGPMAGQFAARNRNALLGAASNVSGGNIFPTGLTGYGVLEAGAAGSSVFGIFGRVDVHAVGSGGANELNCFNYAGPPSAVLPPNQGFGSDQVNCIALQLVSYGNYDASIMLQFGPGVNDAGTASIHARTALYMQPGTFTTYGMVLDSGAQDTGTALMIKRQGLHQAIQLQTAANDNPNGTVLSHDTSLGARTFSLRQNGDVYLNDANLAGMIVFPQSGTVNTVGSAGAAQVLPSNPTGYIYVKVGTTTKRVAYYE